MTRLLVADDSETILLLFERRLEREGYEVQTVRNGQEVLDALDATGEAPDVILLDAMMPGKSGLDVLRELRAAGNPTPVLMVSAHRQVEELGEAEALGAVACLTKPIDWQALLAKVEELTAASGPATT